MKYLDIYEVLDTQQSPPLLPLMEASERGNFRVDVKTVSATLGHSQVFTTSNIYAHTFAQAQARASEAVADALNFDKKKQAYSLPISSCDCLFSF